MQGRNIFPFADGERHLVDSEANLAHIGDIVADQILDGSGALYAPVPRDPGNSREEGQFHVLLVYNRAGNGHVGRSTASRLRRTPARSYELKLQEQCRTLELTDSPSPR